MRLLSIKFNYFPGWRKQEVVVTPILPYVLYLPAN